MDSIIGITSTRLSGVQQIFMPKPEPVQLDPASTWAFFAHDYQIGHYWDDKDPPKNRDGYNRSYTLKQGKPETVTTVEKEDRVKLSLEWRKFHREMFTLAAFGVADMALFAPLELYFEFVMADNRVITNHAIWYEGYMPLAMGGNIGRVIGEARPNDWFGDAWQIETLDASKPPPDVTDVFYNRPWLWSKATVTRYAYPEDGILGLGNPWQHVTPFSHVSYNYNAHVPLLLISNGGMVHVQKTRCKIITDGIIPNPYNPPMERAFV